MQSTGGPVSASGALTYAKQAYLGGLGLYSGYDEKVLMEAVYYGLPMYTFGGDLKDLPLPEIPDDLVPQYDENGLLTAASLSLHPVFAMATATDDRGRDVSYLIADGQDPLVTPGQPILPRVVSQLEEAPQGRAAHGALITGLTTVQSDAVTPAVAEPSVGVPTTGIDRSGVAFPSKFATVTSQQTPDGPVDLLVVTPGRVQTNAGTGTLEKFTQMGVEVQYSGSDETDTVDPVFTAIQVPTEGQTLFRAVVDGTGSDVTRVLLLTENPGSPGSERSWTPTDLTAGLADFDQDGTPETVWAGNAPLSGSSRWIMQAVDEAGNVAIETSRGHLDVAGAGTPQLGDPGPDAIIGAGGRLVRGVAIEDAAEGDRLTATVTFYQVRPDGAKGTIDSAGTATIEKDDDAVTRAIIDRVIETPGSYIATLKVCRVGACSQVDLPVTVTTANTAPSATVTIDSDSAQVWPSATLTANASATDPDDDPTSLRYEWRRNGVDVIGDLRTLDLTDEASPGDVISVLVTPNDGIDDGHQARA